MSTAQVWFQGITALVAVLGFLLSCYSLYLHRRDKRPELLLSTEVESNEAGPAQTSLVVNLANGGPIPIRIVAIYCGLKKAPKVLPINDRLDGDQEPPFVLGVGDSVSWDTNRTALESALFNRLRRDQLLRDAADPESWVPDDPREITEPREMRERRRSGMSVEEQMRGVGAQMLAVLRHGAFLLLSPVIEQSSSFERFVMTNPFMKRLLFGTFADVMVIAVEDSLNNLYTHVPDQ